MGGAVRRFGLAGLLGMAGLGCSDRDSADTYVPAPIVTAPTRVAEGTPRATPAPEVQPADAPKSAVPVKKPSTAVSAQKQLTAYSARLGIILNNRNYAQRVFENEVKSAGKEIEDRGFAALIPPYEKYDQAVDHSIKQLRALKPPPPARKVHEAIVTACTRLEENLEATVGAMHSDGGDSAVELNKDRKTIEAAGAKSIKEALEAGGFDTQAFADRGAFIRKT